MQHDTKLIATPSPYVIRLQTTISALQNFEVDIKASLQYARNSCTFDHVVNEVLTGNYHLYDLGDAYLIGEVQQFPQHSVYHAFVAGGNLQTLMEFFPKFELAGESLGCKYITMTGRRGWVNEMKTAGADAAYTVFMKRIPQSGEPELDLGLPD